MLEDERDQQKSVLRGLLGPCLEEALRAAEPARCGPDEPSVGEVHPDPRRRPGCAQRLGALRVEVMCPLEGRDRLVIASEHQQRHRQKLEIFGRERLGLVCLGERLVRGEPGGLGVRGAGALEIGLERAHPASFATGLSAAPATSHPSVSRRRQRLRPSSGSLFAPEGTRYPTGIRSIVPHESTAAAFAKLAAGKDENDGRGRTGPTQIVSAVARSGARPARPGSLCTTMAPLWVDMAPQLCHNGDMDLRPYVENIHRQLAAAAETAGRTPARWPSGSPHRSSRPFGSHSRMRWRRRSRRSLASWRRDRSSCACAAAIRSSS